MIIFVGKKKSFILNTSHTHKYNKNILIKCTIDYMEKSVMTTF